ncbi:MAG: hypothetical protein JWQ43_3249 [Glaciihabitans sp.]|nr:hypothetical protein [Glaciihabitans sp.]
MFDPHNLRYTHASERPDGTTHSSGKTSTHWYSKRSIGTLLIAGSAALSLALLGCASASGSDSASANGDGYSNAGHHGHHGGWNHEDEDNNGADDASGGGASENSDEGSDGEVENIGDGSDGDDSDGGGTAEPTAPTEPNKPTAPIDAADPTVPIEPTIPVEPATPTDPIEPATPIEPTVPTEPAAPTVPTVPVAPTVPTVPVAATDPVVSGYPVHTNIIATTFWVGEIFDPNLPDGSQVCSTYDSQWAAHWSGVATDTVPDDADGCAGSPTGGCDGIATFNGDTISGCETEGRTAANDFFPSSATPAENPFYLDLPYDDLNDSTAFDERCEVIPWAAGEANAALCDDGEHSFMKNRWVAITGPNGATCYGQIEDAGPSHDDLYHDKEYVFGSSDAQPVQGQFNNAGMDVSPALNGCLGFSDLDGDGDTVSWQFVDDAQVPDGPWSRIITNSGVNN